MTNTSPKHVRPLDTLRVDTTPSAREWAPCVGTELERVLTSTLSVAARPLVRDETLTILSKCVGPRIERGRKTGLVVGRVQSGKTLSFTALIAAAHDNRFRLVVVLGGTKLILANQTASRLGSDLAMSENPSRPWWPVTNPSLAHLATFRQNLRRWDEPDPPLTPRKTLVATVLKHTQRINACAELMRSLVREQLVGSVLIIDDEADQASLNTLIRQGRSSPTYAAINALRDALPAHTYVQYTATPQGPLLIPLLDFLSPEFVATLTPGDGYVGGNDLFVGSDSYVETIPATDIAAAAAPPSLRRAMSLFFVGLTDWLLRGSQSTRNRSMMVHPSHLRDSHATYERWIRSIVSEWSRILLDSRNPDRALVVADFQAAYDDLAENVEGMSAFSAILERLPNALTLTEIRVVNSERDIDIPWRVHPAWLLIGGANLDRGFTVEGLTVTYMPRGPGVSNADTIQQRGRFFGYKRPYLGYCRVFLEHDVRESFASYVRHEASIHTWLSDSLARGVSLRELPRHFLIDPNLKPTRAQILTNDVRRIGGDQEWFRQHTPIESIDACRENGELWSRFLEAQNLILEDDPPHSLPDQRTPYQRHKYADIRLAVLFTELLVRLRMPGSEDSQRWLSALCRVEQLVARAPEAMSRVLLMRPGQSTGRKVTGRKLDNPFQGPHPDRHGRIYPGDQRIRGGVMTLQHHSIDLYDGPVDDGRIIESAVPILAAWLAPGTRGDDSILLDPAGASPGDA